MHKTLKQSLAVIGLCACVAPAMATTWMIGDDDGYGMGIPDNGDHPFNGFTANYDGRSAAEKIATDGAQFTDTYSTTHSGYGPQAGTVATFEFTGLGSGWSQGSMWFDMADFQAQYGAVAVSYNGIVQNWAFVDGFPHTKVRNFNLDQNVLDTINSTGKLIVTIDRNGSNDFYGFDYAMLSSNAVPAVPEPSSLIMMLTGACALLSRRSRRN